MKKIYYWSPFINHVGTTKSVLNSSIGLKKYFFKKYDVSIFDVSGEWKKFNSQFENNKVNVIKLYKKSYFERLGYFGYLKSRISMLKIFFLSFFSLYRYLKKFPPDYLVIHLITSLPLLIVLIFNIDTKIILRLSGFPKLNIFRKFLWKICHQKIELITCPSIETMEILKKKSVFEKRKIFFLPDPFISYRQNKYEKKYHNLDIKLDNFFLSIGRLTKQKNFAYLINEFSNCEFVKENYKLIILGEGEDRRFLQNLINKKKLNNQIFLLGWKENVQKYLKNAEAFILSSLWEDPGAVLIEAISANTFVISSDCKSGPSEILINGDGGYLFKSNKDGELTETLNKYKDNLNLINSHKIKAKKNIKKYSIFQHSKKLDLILN